MDNDSETVQWSTFAGTIVLESILSVLFITIFFFVYLEHLEKTTFLQQLKNISDGVFKDLDLTPEARANLLRVLNEEKNKPLNPSIVQADHSIDENNSLLRNKTIRWLSVGAWFAFVIVFLLIQYGGASWKHVSKAFLTLIVIGLTEFCFAAFITSKFRAIDGNDLIKIVLDETKKT